MDVPNLWIHGTADSSVPVAKSVAVLDTLVSNHGRPFEVASFAGAEHLGFVMEFPFDLAPGLSGTITDWLGAQARIP